MRAPAGTAVARAVTMSRAKKGLVALFVAMVIAGPGTPRAAVGLSCAQPLGESAELTLEQVTEDGVAVDPAPYAGFAVRLHRYDSDGVVHLYYDAPDGPAWFEDYQ